MPKEYKGYVKTDAHGREIEQHGSAAFPMCCYHFTRPMNINVPLHWHDEFEAGVILNGEVNLHVGKHLFDLREGDGFFINAGVLHAFYAKGASDTRMDTVVFHPRLVAGTTDSIYWVRFIRPLIENQNLQSLVFRKDSEEDQKEMALVHSVCELCDAPSFGFEFDAREMLAHFLIHIIHTGPAAPKMKRAQEKRLEGRMKEMLSFIHGHYDEEITLAQIASVAAVSESECIRDFRKAIGETPVQYMKQYRLQKAAERIGASQDTISRIASECGFHEMSYFTRAFRARYGTTPTQYRAQNRE